MSSILRSVRLVELCTTSINYDAQVQSACASFDPQMYEIIDDTGVVIMIPNIMGLTDSTLVDILAWQFHVDFYDPTKDLEFRKNLVQMSIQWHITKGTPDLIQWVLDTYWPGGATLEEWFTYKIPFPAGFTPPNPPYSTINSPPITTPPAAWHDRYRFRVLIDQNVIVNSADENAVVALIERYKPISRWLEEILRPRTSECDIGWCGMVLRFIYRESEAPAYP